MRAQFDFNMTVSRGQALSAGSTRRMAPSRNTLVGSIYGSYIRWIGPVKTGKKAMNSRVIPFRVLFILVLAGILLAGCGKNVAPVNCIDPDFECYINQAIKGIVEVRREISYWSNLHLAAQILIAISGIVATIMIALQGDENRVWTRPTGLVATALVTGLTSALVSFHVPENIDKLVDVVGDMTKTTNEFAYKANILSGGRELDELKELYKKDVKFPQFFQRASSDVCV